MVQTTCYPKSARVELAIKNYSSCFLTLRHSSVIKYKNIAIVQKS